MARSVSLVFVLLASSPVVAQSERYELGRRLKAFETAWEKQDDPAARKRALADLPKVTTQFFALRLGEAGRTLDQATHALTTDIAPSLGRQWVWSLSACPESRILDGSARELTVTIQPFYPIKGDMPKGLEFQLWFTNKDVVTIKPDKFPFTVKVPLPPLGESPGLDRKLYFLADGAKELRPVAVGVSQIADVRKRLDAIAAIKVTAKPPFTIETATAFARAALIRDVLEPGSPLPPTDLPYADLLANAETMLDGKRFFTTAKHGQFWMSVPVGERMAVPCRVYIPKGLDKAKPVPIVFGLHGAGVDENMFFESYGAGQIVKECEKRGWVLVCPRSGFFDAPPLAAILESLTQRYPLDAKRVFLVGHSMGAMQALSAAASTQFAAVAALGGGTKPAKMEAFATLPTFLGVGDQDGLALTGVRALKKTLTDSGAKAFTYKEYPGIEHLLIVREALPDVFEMFDRVAR